MPARRQRRIPGATADRPAVMTDVAQLAGVSHQTVSRVLNGHPRVRPETRERVLAAVAKLGYRPNAMARGLASRRSRVLGVVSVDTLLYGPAATLLGIERAARAAGYGVSIVTLARVDATSVAGAVQILVDQGVDGVILIAPQPVAPTGRGTAPAGVVTVAVGAGSGSPLPTATVDQIAGARLAVRHLLELGHRTVWHIAGPADWLDARDRAEGWRGTLEEAGAPVPPMLAGDWSARSGYAAGARLAAAGAGVTAVFVANDQMALGLLRALHERGLRVPRDISVVAFDDVPEAEFMQPPLTTVRQDFDELGRRSMSLLLRLIEFGPSAAPDPTPGASGTVLPTLVVRESTAPPRPGGPATG